MNKVPKNKVSYSESIKVTLKYIDTLNHVNNLVYLKWVLEISGKHWNLLAPLEIKEQNIWIVLRHEIDYLAPAFLDDTLNIYTWVGETAGVRSVRYVDIYRDDILLAKCKTTWVMADPKTLRPKRIGEEVLAILIKN